jgi:hypothetical protein
MWNHDHWLWNNQTIGQKNYLELYVICKFFKETNQLFKFFNKLEHVVILFWTWFFNFEIVQKLKTRGYIKI